jgi:hypothetical protein
MLFLTAREAVGRYSPARRQGNARGLTGRTVGFMQSSPILLGSVIKGTMRFEGRRFITSPSERVPESVRLQWNSVTR